MKPFPMISLTLILAVAVLAGCAAPLHKPAAPTAPAVPAAGRLHWFGAAAVLYHGSLDIYFDPVDLTGNPPTADLILVSNGQNDFCNLEAIQKVRGPQTTLIFGPNAAGFYQNNRTALGAAMVLAASQTVSLPGATVQAVAAKNDGGHHPIQDAVGFLVQVDGTRLYYAGATRYYPEMSTIQSDLTIYPATTQADLEQVAKVLPTRAMVIVYTSATLSNIFAQALAQANPAIQFVALQPGPYTP